MRKVFIAGATGYMGSRLASRLAADCQVSALVRPGSQRKLPSGIETVTGNALDADSYLERVPEGSVFVHLVGTPHPSPWKEREFRQIDLVSLRESVKAARIAKVSHFVYVSVAQPAPVMRAYIRVRQECEGIIEHSGLAATILRPWYVLGPGHLWPVVLKPIYRIFETIGSTRESAIRLGLVTLDQMLDSLEWSVRNPTEGHRVFGVAEIRSGNYARTGTVRKLERMGVSAT